MATIPSNQWAARAAELAETEPDKALVYATLALARATALNGRSVGENGYVVDRAPLANDPEPPEESGNPDGPW